MINISRGKLGTQNFSNRQSNVQQRQTLVNALDTVDYESYKYNKKANDMHKLSLYVPTLTCLLAYTKLAPKFKKTSLFSKFAFLTSFTMLSLLGFGLYGKKQADKLYKSNIAGQQDAMEELKDPRLFLSFTEEKQQILENNSLYKYYLEKRYSKYYSIFTDLNLAKHIKFSKEINDKMNSFYPANTDTNAVSKAINEIDNKTQDYTKKITAGMNILFAAGTAASACIPCIGSKILNKLNISRIKKVGIQTFLELIPFIGIAGVACSNYFNKAEQYSRYKAKEDFINNRQENNSILHTTIEYLRTRGEYRQKIQRQKDLAAVKNAILKTSEVSQNEINQAKNFQTKFFNTINSKERTDNMKKNLLNNSLSKDWLLYSLALPIFFIYDLIGNKKNSRKNKQSSLFKLYSLVTGSYLANALLISALNKNKIDK